MLQEFSVTDNTKLDNTKMVSTNLYPGITIMPLNPDNSNTIESGAAIIGQPTSITNDTSISLVSGIYAKNLQNGGYIQIPYVCPGGTLKPNATFVDNLTTKNYKTANLYIFKATHAMQNMSYDAEMVIEMNPITNGGEKLYLCFLLTCQRNKKLKPNEIDNIIIRSMKINTYKRNYFDLQPLIDNNQQKILYNSNADRVVIFTKPINIKEYDFSNYNQIPSNLFILFPTNDYVVLNPTSVQEGFGDKKTAVMTCTPINTGEPAENDNSVIITNTDGGANLLSHSIMAGIMTTVIFIIICLFVQPTLYFFMMSSTNVDTNEKILFNIVLIVLLAILGLVLVLNGAKNDKSEQLAGVIICIYLILSIVGILFHNKDYEGLGLNLSSFSILTAWDRIIAKIMQQNTALGIIISIIVLFIIFITVGELIRKGKVKSLKNKKINPSNLSKLIMGIGITYGFIMVCTIAVFQTKPPM
jgi:hypothetical protein